MSTVTMPTVTYIIRFVHCDKDEIEEQHHTDAKFAWEAFRLFVEPESFDIYSRVELIERNWEEHQDYPLAQVSFLGC